MTNQKENRVADNCNAVLVRSEADSELFFGIVFVMIYSIIKKTDCENCIEIFISCEKLFCEGIGHFVGIPHDFRRTVVFAWHCQVE